MKYKSDRMIALEDQDISSSEEEENFSASSSEEEVFELLINCGCIATENIWFLTLIYLSSVALWLRKGHKNKPLNLWA